MGATVRSVEPLRKFVISHYTSGEISIMEQSSRDRYNIQYKRPFEESLTRLDRQARLEITAAIDALASNPRPSWAKPLPNLPNFYIMPICSCYITCEVQDADNDDADNKLILWELRDEMELAQQYDGQHPDREKRRFRWLFSRER